MNPPLLCALNPGRPVNLITNARRYGQPINVRYSLHGVVQGVRPTCVGWQAIIRTHNPFTIAFVPLEAVTGPVVDVYQERRHKSLPPRKVAGL
jgi:hypothetical protein